MSIKPMNAYHALPRVSRGVFVGVEDFHDAGALRSGGGNFLGGGSAALQIAGINYPDFSATP